MDPKDWKYLAEGGANIIFRYAGSDHEYANKVLRIRKNCMFSKFIFTNMLASYHDFICRQLNLEESIGLLSEINVSDNFLLSLDNDSFSYRPIHRRLKNRIDTSCLIAFMMPDLLSQSFSCEIKPKWSGFEYENFHLSNGICKCRFCLAQLTKGRRLINCNSANNYCPKLLFSNDTKKISVAITDLFVNSSNQFKLYVDSIQISPEELPLNPIISQIISYDPIFQNIIQFQHKLLDKLIFEFDEIESIDHDQYKLDIENICSTSKNEYEISSLPNYLRVLLAMSVRDSSIIISFSPFCKFSKWKSIKANEIGYNYKIDIIDLDIKPIQKLVTYIEEIKKHG